MLFFDGVGNSAGIFAMSFFLIFLYQYLTGKISLFIFYFLIGISTFFIILRATNGLHSFYYLKVEFLQVVHYLQIYRTFGPAFTALVCTFTTVLLFTIFYVISRRRNYHRVYHRQLNITIYFMIAFTVYSLASAVNLHLVNIPVFAHLCLLPGIAFCFYTFRKNLINLQPIAIENPLEEIVDGMMMLSGEGIIVDLNQPMCKILDTQWKVSAGNQIQDISPEFYAKLEEIGLYPTDTQDSRQKEYDFVFMLEDEGYDTTVYFTNRFIKVTMHNVTKLLKLVETESQLAAIDPLTGIFNRRYSEQTIKNHLLNRRTDDHPYCFVVFDIDYFKEINDNFGHQTGDIILKEIANIFRESIRPSDIFGRFGGDEFILLLHKVTEEQALAILNRIHKNIKVYPFKSDSGKVVRPTISIGAIIATTSAELPYDELFFMADEALYQAKERGKDQIILRRHTPFSTTLYY